MGELRELQWNTSGLSRYFNFEYSVDAGETWIKEAVVRASDKSYQWKTPDIVSDRVKIRLSDVNNPDTFCESERTIRIISRDDFASTSQPENKAWWVKSELRKKNDQTLP